MKNLLNLLTWHRATIGISICALLPLALGSFSSGHGHSPKLPMMLYIAAAVCLTWIYFAIQFQCGETVLSSLHQSRIAGTPEEKKSKRFFAVVSASLYMLTLMAWSIIVVSYGLTVISGETIANVLRAEFLAKNLPLVFYYLAFVAVVDLAGISTLWVRFVKQVSTAEQAELKTAHLEERLEKRDTFIRELMSLVHDSKARAFALLDVDYPQRWFKVNQVTAQIGAGARHVLKELAEQGLIQVATVGSTHFYASRTAPPMHQ